MQVLVADSDDEVVDHASLLNSFGNDNTNIITPVPRMHSIKPEWDEDVSEDASNLAPVTLKILPAGCMNVERP